MADGSLHGEGQVYEAIGRGTGPYGVAMTTSGTIHTKGSYAAFATPTYGGSWLCVHLHGFSAVAGTPGDPYKLLVDVACGAPGFESPLVADLLLIHPACTTSVGASVLLPVAVAAGVPLSARAQAADGTAATVRASLSVVSCGGNASAPGATCETWGANAAATDGTNVTPGGGGSYGSYAQLTAASAYKADWLVLAFGLPGSPPVAGSTHAYLVDVAVGAAGFESVVLPAWPVTFDASGSASCFYTPPLPLTIPAGSRVSVRVRTSTTGPNLSVVAYAVGG